jgi:hypothetical protein
MIQLNDILATFLNGATNDADSIDIIDRIGWLQMLKGYIPNDWTSRRGKRPSIEEHVKKIIKASGGRRNLSSSYGRTAIPCGKIGVQLRMHLTKQAQTIPAPAFERRHTYEWN